MVPQVPQLHGVSKVLEMFLVEIPRWQDVLGVKGALVAPCTQMPEVPQVLKVSQVLKMPRPVT